MTTANKRTLLISLCIVIVVAVALVFLLKPTDNSPFVPLFSYDLDKNQMEQVKTYLTKQKIDFQVDKSAGIQVHESKRDDILVDIATQGIPSK